MRHYSDQDMNMNEGFGPVRLDMDMSQRPCLFTLLK